MVHQEDRRDHVRKLIELHTADNDMSDNLHAEHIPNFRAPSIMIAPRFVDVSSQGKADFP